MKTVPAWLLPSSFDGKVNSAASLLVKFPANNDRGEPYCAHHLKRFINETEHERDWVQSPAGIIIPLTLSQDAHEPAWLVNDGESFPAVYTGSTPCFIAPALELPQHVHCCSNEAALEQLWQQVCSDDKPPQSTNACINGINRNLDSAIWRLAQERCPSGLLVVSPMVTQQRLIVAAFEVAREFKELVYR